MSWSKCALALVASLSVHLGAAETERFDAIIYLKAKPDLAHANHIVSRTSRVAMVQRMSVRVAEASQKPLVAYLRRTGIAFRPFYIVNAILVERVTAEQVRAIVARPEVKFAVKNTPFRPTEVQTLAWPYSLSAYDIPGQIQALGVDRVWSDLKVDGKGIVLGSIDSGVMWDHEGLISRYRGFDGRRVNHDYNWHDGVQKSFAPEPPKHSCAIPSPEPCDDLEHGTHTVGTMVGEEAGRDRFGVAPGAKWIACRGLEYGWGSVASYLSCLEFMLAPYPFGGDPRKDGRPDMAPHIINISWICEATQGCKRGDELFDAVQALHDAGIMVVVAAGNAGPTCKSVFHAPASYSQLVVTVGAFDHRDGGIAEFSARGPSTFDDDLVPALTAPGVFLRSTIPGGRYGSYDFKSGTSMAAPHVAGVVALLWSARPELIGNLARTREILFQTATPRYANESCGRFSGNQIPNVVYGYGIVDAWAVLNARK